MTKLKKRSRTHLRERSCRHALSTTFLIFSFSGNRTINCNETFKKKLDKTKKKTQCKCKIHSSQIQQHTLINSSFKTLTPPRCSEKKILFLRTKFLLCSFCFMALACMETECYYRAQAGFELTTSASACQALGRQA